jgi:hypothetical protein
MFHGTLIEELFEIVERVEVHTQPVDMQPIDMHPMEMKMTNPEAVYPAFLTELLQANFGIAGVA